MIELKTEDSIFEKPIGRAITILQKMSVEEIAENYLLGIMKNDNSLTAAKELQDWYGMETIKCFTQGFCYWFARLLSLYYPGGKLYYTLNTETVLDRHFVYMYQNRYYDITGDITDDFLKDLYVNRNEIVDWETAEDNEYINYRAVVRGCVEKTS